MNIVKAAAVAASISIIFIITGPPEIKAETKGNPPIMIEVQPSGPGGAGSAQGRPGLIDRFDKDGDERVSRSEFPGPDEIFTLMDKNGDNLITREEEASAPPPPGRGGQGKGQQGPVLMQAPPGQGDQGMGQKPMVLKPSDDFYKADKDKDKKISMKEFKGPKWAFDLLDRNSDGYISEPEAVKLPSRRTGMRRPGGSGGPGGGQMRPGDGPGMRPGGGPGNPPGGNMGQDIMPPYAPGMQPKN